MRCVVVAGAGPAGLVAAITLARAGVRSVVVDRLAHDDIAADAGGAYELTASALRALHAIGAGDAVRRRGTTLSRFELRSYTDRVLQRLDFRAAGLEVFSITRSGLQQALFEQLDPAMVEIVAGSSVERVHEADESVVVTTSNGATIDADFAIGADGMHSVLRRAAFDPDPPRDVGIRAWWGHTAVGVLARDVPHGVSIGWTGPGRSFVLAVGGPTHEPRALWTACTASASAEEPSLAQATAGLPELVQRSVSLGTAVARTGILEQQPLARWRAGRTVLLGDAAHGMAPFLGLGANSAIEDASQIAGVLGSRAFDEVLGDLDAAMGRRVRAMNPRIAEARRLGHLMHARSAVGHALVRAVMWAIPERLVLRELRARHHA